MELDKLERKNGELSKALDEKTQHCTKLQKEIHKNIKTHEEEV